MITAITYSIISVLLLALIKELKPEFANLGGIYVTVILSRHVLEKITIFSDEMFKILGDKLNEEMSLIFEVIGISIISNIGSDLCVQLGYSTMGKIISLYGKIGILLISLPLVQELLEGVQAMFL